MKKSNKNALSDWYSNRAKKGAELPIKINKNYIISDGKGQDTPEQEIKEKFEPKKLQSELLAQSYSRIGYDNKAYRVAECGTFLEFARTIGQGSGGAPRGCPCGAPEGTQTANVSNFKLHNANFCRDRLCPMCSWRRSYKIFAQVSQIMNVIGGKYAYLFVTLTVPNCIGEELSDTITDINKAWHRFIGYKRIKSAVKGFFKALEVTRNKDNGTYHPHIHCVVAVNPSYFKSRDYMQRDEWLQLWQRATKDSSITQVDVRRARSKQNAEGEQAVKALSSAVAEIAKYAVKSSDYLISDNTQLTDEIVGVLVPALANRRLCSFGGVFEEVRQQLQLDDCEDGDLIHLDGEINSELAVQIYRYGWSAGAYKLIEVKEKSEL